MWKLITVDGCDLICYDNGDIWRQNKSLKYKEEIWTKFVSKFSGYWRIRINGKRYYNHRFICLAFKGLDLKSKLVVDHINHNIHDNSIANLRCITNQQNLFNTNAKGYYKGVYIKKDGTVVEYWRICLQINGKLITKCVKTEELARQGYLELKRIHHLI
jgi:hypothetical protein